uniref:Uncharacterized protein n=1 Tax=Opuntia streptacantha TaxID=393608 RepID=A0A7C8YZ04_OPUST
MMSCRGHWTGRVGKEEQTVVRFSQTNRATSPTPLRIMLRMPSIATIRSPSTRVAAATSILQLWSQVLILHLWHIGYHGKLSGIHPSHQALEGGGVFICPSLSEIWKLQSSFLLSMVLSKLDHH